MKLVIYLTEDDDNQVSDTFFILNQDSSPNTPYKLKQLII